MFKVLDPDGSPLSVKRSQESQELHPLQQEICPSNNFRLVLTIVLIPHRQCSFPQCSFPRFSSVAHVAQSNKKTSPQREAHSQPNANITCTANKCGSPQSRIDPPGIEHKHREGCARKSAVGIQSTAAGKG